MKMPYFVFATALLISLGAGCSPSQPNNAVQPPETKQNAAKSRISVAILNFNFQPSDISAKQGDTIIFTNQDSVPHTITSQGFDSGQLQNGQSFTLNTINLNPGTYSFHCSIHPSMTGIITIK